MDRKFRLVRSFQQGIDGNKCYRVESEDLLTVTEAMQLLRELNSSYNGQLLDNKPTPRV